MGQLLESATAQEGYEMNLWHVEWSIDGLKVIQGWLSTLDNRFAPQSEPRRVSREFYARQTPREASWSCQRVSRLEDIQQPVSWANLQLTPPLLILREDVLYLSSRLLSCWVCIAQQLGTSREMNFGSVFSISSMLGSAI